MKQHRESIIAVFIAGIVALAYISGLPAALFLEVEWADVDPVCITLFINILAVMAVGWILVKRLLPGFPIGFTKKHFQTGLKRYGLSCLIAFAIPCLAFCVGLAPFDYSPTVWKLLMEGVLYYAGVGLIEEFFCRGLLQNAMERMLSGRKNGRLKAVVVTSLIFGLGHIAGMVGMPVLLAVCKIAWAVGLGIYLGAVYTRTGNLWLAALFHWVIDLCGLPFCFSTQKTYPTISAAVILITFILFGIYGVFLVRQEDSVRESK